MLDIVDGVAKPVRLGCSVMALACWLVPKAIFLMSKYDPCHASPV